MPVGCLLPGAGKKWYEERSQNRLTADRTAHSAKTSYGRKPGACSGVGVGRTAMRARNYDRYLAKNQNLPLHRVTSPLTSSPGTADEWRNLRTRLSKWKVKYASFTISNGDAPDYDYRPRSRYPAYSDFTLDRHPSRVQIWKLL